jgi:pyruvate dehydrogenase E2 component (dihydrolipoamide acetyltransferase)
MPKFGQMTEESAIVEWRKKEGDKIAKGDVLFTVETDKSVMDVEAFADGTLLKIIVQPGLNVPVASTVGFLGTPGEPIPAIEPPKPAAPKPAAHPPASAPAPVTPKSVPTPALATVPAPVAMTPSAVHSPTPSAPSIFRISPRARSLVERCVIDPKHIKGTGPEGRIVERDVKAHLESRGYDRLRISPAAKNLAASENVDLLAVTPSDGGRITVADVETALKERPRAMSKMRQVIAQRLTQSFRDIPHFYVTVSVDMTDLIAYRSELKAAGAPYTVTDFIAEAVILSLLECPEVNSNTDGKSVSWKSHVNLGVAVSLDGGLVVPVVRHAETLSLLELCQQSKALAEKARNGKLMPDDMTGGTFTISNMGMLDVENFGAIINPGEAAILAVSSTKPTPVVRDGKIVARQIMKMTVSCDHRVVDGALGAKFINTIKQKLEDIDLWKRLTA